MARKFALDKLKLPARTATFRYVYIKQQCERTEGFVLTETATSSSLKSLPLTPRIVTDIPPFGKRKNISMKTSELAEVI